MRRRGFLAMLAGVVVAAKVEVFGGLEAAMAQGPGGLAKRIVVLNKAYLDAPYEDVIIMSKQMRDLLQVNRVGRVSGDCPKNFEEEDALRQHLPNRYVMEDGEFRQVMPYVAIDVPDDWKGGRS